MKALRLFSLLGVLFVCNACSLFESSYPDPRPVVPYFGEEASRGFSRVVVLPLDVEDPEGGENEAEHLRKALVSVMTKRNVFEAIPITQADLEDINIKTTRASGIYKTEDLVAIAKRFGADGAIYGVVSRFRSYPEVKVGVRLYLIDCRNGHVPWATDVYFDAADRNIEQDVHNYHATVLRDTNSLEGFRNILISPRLFSNYAAYRIVGTLEKTLHSHRWHVPVELPPSMAAYEEDPEDPPQSEAPILPFPGRTEESEAATAVSTQGK